MRRASSSVVSTARSQGLEVLTPPSYYTAGGMTRLAGLTHAGGRHGAANRGSRLDSPKPSPQRRNQCSYVISGRSRPQVGRGLAGARAGIVLAGVPPSTSTRVAWSVPVIPKYPSTVAAPPIGTDAGATGNPS